MTDRPEPSTGDTSGDDDAIELASRYVDGDLTAAERAAAEGDPEVMAWVERFTPARAALQEPVVADDAAREGAIAAALAAFDALGESPRAVAPGAVSAPVITDLAAARARRNGRLGKWLGAAAAAVALGVAGVAIGTSRGGGDDASSVDPRIAASLATGSDATALGGSTADKVGTAAGPTTTVGTFAADSAQPNAAEPSAQESSSDTTAAGSDSAATTVAPSNSTVAAGAAPNAATTTTTTSARSSGIDLQTPEALLDYAMTASLPDEPAATPLCERPGRLVSVSARYQGEPVVIYVDDEAGTVTVYDAATCEFVAGVPIPQP